MGLASSESSENLGESTVAKVPVPIFRKMGLAPNENGGLDRNLVAEFVRIRMETAEFYGMGRESFSEKAFSMWLVV
jgi:hypothetical protein